MIRKALLADIPRISEILVFSKRSAYRKIFKDDLFSFNEIQVCSIANDYLSNPQKIDTMYVYDDGIVKGFINIGESRDEELKNYLEIYELYVEPFFQGQKVGRALIERFVTNRTQNISLWVIKDNERARAFYESVGFKTDGEQKLVLPTDIIQIRYILVV